MEKNSTTVILICAIIFIIIAFTVFFLKINTMFQNGKREITQQSRIAQTNKIQNNTAVQDRVQKTNKTRNNTNLQNRVPKTNKTNEVNRTTSINNLFLIVLLVITICLIIIPTISYWKIYSENGESSFASIIPIYSQMVLYRIVGLKEWYALLVFIPFVGTITSGIFSVYATYLLGKKYEKSILFILGLMFLPFIFLPILALSKLPKKYDAFYDSY